MIYLVGCGQAFHPSASSAALICQIAKRDRWAQMVVSSRTPEGMPSHCVLCGAENKLDFSDPAGDAPCPNCGHLLWLSAQLLAAIQNRLPNMQQSQGQPISPEASLDELGATSLDLVEVVMTLEEEMDLQIPEHAAESIQTVGDAIRYLEKLRRNRGDA